MMVYVPFFLFWYSILVQSSTIVFPCSIGVAANIYIYNLVKWHYAQNRIPQIYKDGTRTLNTK